MSRDWQEITDVNILVVNTINRDIACTVCRSHNRNAQYTCISTYAHFPAQTMNSAHYVTFKRRLLHFVNLL